MDTSSWQEVSGTAAGPAGSLSRQPLIQSRDGSCVKSSNEIQRHPRFPSETAVGCADDYALAARTFKDSLSATAGACERIDEVTGMNLDYRKFHRV